jgi:hypothetical protein
MFLSQAVYVLKPLHLTNKTTFSGGSRSDAVKGRKIHLTYHFEGNRAIADTVTFIK